MSLANVSCSLFGSSTYVTGWYTGIYVVISISIMAIAISYILSKILTGNLSSKLASIAKYELMQLFLTVIIILILLGTLSTVCSFTQNLSYSMTGMYLQPFNYSDYYIGNLAFGRGVAAVEKIYTYSISYGIDARIWDAVSAFIGKVTTTKTSPLTSISFEAGGNFGALFSILSDGYMTVFIILVLPSIGILMLQWLALPIIEYTAFVVLVPVALVMRSFAFLGPGLRKASTDILALAIIFYIAYPLMIAFDSYAINFIFSTSNPTYGCTYCLISPFDANSISTTGFLSKSISSPTSISIGGIATSAPAVSEMMSSVAPDLLSAVSPLTMISQFKSIITTVGEYIFVALFMFGINLTIVVAGALGLSKVLNSGFNEAPGFWTNL